MPDWRAKPFYRDWGEEKDTPALADNSSANISKKYFSKFFSPSKKFGN